MKKAKPAPKPKGKRTFEDENYGGKNTQNYTVSDKQQEAGETGYDNEGAFGIGMIKGK